MGGAIDTAILEGQLIGGTHMKGGGYVDLCLGAKGDAMGVDKITQVATYQATKTA